MVYIVSLQSAAFIIVEHARLGKQCRSVVSRDAGNCTQPSLNDIFITERFYPLAFKPNSSSRTTDLDWGKKIGHSNR